MTDSSQLPSFDSLGLNSDILSALKAAGFDTGTPVQARAIPAILEGRDVRALAETGSGKTLAFGLPILQALAEKPRTVGPSGNPIAALVVVPTRELAVQIADVLSALAAKLEPQPKVLAVHGGVKINPQMMALRGGADLLVSTPGRLLDLNRKNAVDLQALRTLVLDEADRMLSLGFHEELQEVFALLPQKRQTLLFSATFPPQLEPLMQALLTHPVEINLAPEQTTTLIEQHVYTVDQPKKSALLIHLIKEQELEQVLVFVSVKKTGDRLVKKLYQAGLSTAVFHGDRSQAERTRVLDEFRSGTLRVLIATDLAARGIDIDSLPAVINYELPRSPNDYAHRIGRTGRAGKSGVALSLICHAEYQHFRVIEKRLKRRLPREQVPGFEAGETTHKD